MSDQFDVFVHREGGRPKVVQASTGEPLADALRRADAAVDLEALVFIGESEHACADDRDEDDCEDNHEPVSAALTVGELGICHGGHVHCHRCRRVAVEVNYGGRTKRHRFSPAATVATASKWARKKFKLTDTDVLFYVLQICDSTKQPRGHEHLGELVHFPACRARFDLVPHKPKIEG